jgi:hypothetical protein
LKVLVNEKSKIDQQENINEESNDVKIIKEAFEAFGKVWPIGSPTEFGWKFQDSLSGLNEFEFTKIKKLE